MPRIVSLNIGHPRVMLSAVNGEPYTSSVGRRPSPGPIELTMRGFANDSCSYSGHGGENMAVNCFPMDNYQRVAAWSGRELAIPSFGENLTLEGLPDDEACVGDLFQCGEALLQVSQPREPCGNLVRFLGLPGIVKWMNQNLVSGYYFRAIAPGRVATGDDLKLVKRGHSEWTIRRLNQAMFLELRDEKQVMALQKLDLLSANWKRSLLRQFESQRRRTN